MVFNGILDLKLIKLVSDNPVLYDHNNPKYMDFNEREVVWQKIGDELKRPAAECKNRWINIRDINRRILRKSLSNPNKRQRLYKYHNDLSFMKPFYRDINIPNESCEWDDNDDESNFETNLEDAGSNLEGSIKEKLVSKRKTKLKTGNPVSERKSSKSTTENSKKKEKRFHKKEKRPVAATSAPEIPVVSHTELDASDPVDAFLLSIGAILKTFSQYHLNLAKSQIFDIVQEHDLQQIVQKQN